MIRRLAAVLNNWWGNGPRLLTEGIVIGCKDTLTLCQQLVVLPYLCQSNSCVYISHVGFHTHTHNIIAPTACLTFGKGILGLTVQCHHTKLLIELGVIERCRHIQTDGTTFCCSDVFDGMEREDDDIRICTRELAMIVRTDGMPDSYYILCFSCKLQIHRVAYRDGAAALIYRSFDLAEKLISERLLDRDVVGISTEQL